MEYSSVQKALDVVAWTVRPVGLVLYYIILVIFSILKLLSGPIITALQPFLYLLYALWLVASLPFRLLAKLEPVYDYIGAAVILGVVIGLGLNYSFHRADESLNFDFLLAYLPNQGRTAKQYRAAKIKEEDIDIHSLSPYEYASLSDSMGSATRSQKSKNLMDQTILEEDDSDF